jgi:WD40 repeat protein
VFPRFSPDGRRLVAVTADSFHCWEVGGWRPTYHLRPDDTSTSQPSTATFRPDGRLIAVFHRFNRTHLIDAVRGKVVATLDLDRHVPLCFSPDGGSLVMGTEDGELKILNLRMIRRQLAAMDLDWEMPPLPPPSAIKGPDHLVLNVVSNSPLVSASQNK